MKFERYIKGETVFHCGDIPDKFYIILSGSVNVFLPKS
jgi:CRP-like cAMP-binding protein